MLRAPYDLYKISNYLGERMNWVECRHLFTGQIATEVTLLKPVGI